MDHEQTLPTTSAAQVSPTTVAAHVATQPEQIQVAVSSSGESNGAHGRESRPQTGQTSSTGRHLLARSEGHQTFSRAHDNPYPDFERIPVPPSARSRDSHAHVRHTMMSASGLPPPHRIASGIDQNMPLIEEKSDAKRTVGARLKPTIDNAIVERNKYAKKALWTSYTLNIAIGIQVLLGALTTGIAAAVTSAKQAQLSTAILGGLSTLVASYLARARGSGEPELSITRTKDLEQFLRECMAFQMDYGHEYATPESDLNRRLEDLRYKFEELLGNANGERKLSPVGITQTAA